MFDIGFLELLVIALITLVVMGPERLPEAIRAISLWFGRLKQIWAKTRQEIENEVGMDDIRHQLHNEEVLRDLGEQKDQLEQTLENHKTGQP
ncbi:MAG: twin-arginine translocase subunit TatB [Cellvibrionales bacterium TMED47]|nr:twin-arginine translocase subunit TatB [Porticoccaceae bacterium]RPG82608.1 MAG: twin-arginine translocase subunit TatB [Cellvibrionales bacterium TMED47]|tara:strand:- start:14015 stop:14290 length:276 start_codon:yes stop_codon:yes gene_type:complete